MEKIIKFTNNISIKIKDIWDSYEKRNLYITRINQFNNDEYKYWLRKISELEKEWINIESLFIDSYEKSDWYIELLDFNDSNWSWTNFTKVEYEILKK